MDQKVAWLCLAIVACCSLAGALSPNIACDSAVQTFVCLPRNYSSMDIPLTTEPNQIRVDLHISDVLKINDRDFSITFALYFNVKWKEPRLHLNPSFSYFQNKNGSYDENQLNPVDLNLIHDLWVPNVFIYNLKTFKVIDVLSKLAGLWVTGKKEIMYSQASHITFICPMIFNYFPLDTQVCKFQVGSYSYNMEKMIFEATHLGYAHVSRSLVLDYEVHIQKLRDEDMIFVGGDLGNFSLAGFEMVLVRHVSHYIINYYLPSGLFVVVSWISFLVPADVIPGRMALLVTLFLVLVNIFNTVTTNTPKAEGLTAIEAWMLACILFVFGALTEYAALLFTRGWDEDEDDDLDDFSTEEDKLEEELSMMRRHRTNGGESFGSVCSGKDATDALQMTPLNESSGTGMQLDPHSPVIPGRVSSAAQTHRTTAGIASSPTALDKKKYASKRKKNQRERFMRIDRFFLVLFPLLFLTFNCVYWLAYYFSQDHTLGDLIQDFAFTKKKEA